MVRADVITTAGTAVLAAGFASAIDPVHHMRALSTSTSTTACAAEAEACAFDASCLACLEAYSIAAESCSTSAAATCDALEDLVCCASAGCEDNSIFTDIIDCFNVEAGCGFYVSTCAAGGGTGSDGVVTSDSTTALDDTSVTTSDRGITTTYSTTATDDTTPSTTYSTTATDDTTSSTTTSPCPAEQQACLADPACLACGEATVGLQETCQGLDYDTETATCSERLDVICCYLDGIDVDCANDELLGAWQACEAVDDGCDFTFADCAAGGDSSTLVGGDDATTSDRGITATDSTTTATDDTTSSTTTSACQAEQAACTADADCLACAEAVAATDTDAVAEICEPAGYDEETASCSEKLEVGCCGVEEALGCVMSNDLMFAWMDCLAGANEDCDISLADCADIGDSSTLVGGDDATTATTDGEETEESLPFLGGDDEGEEEADGVEVDVDDDDPADADAADTDADSAPRSAAVGGATAVFVAAAVSLAFMAA